MSDIKNPLAFIRDVTGKIIHLGMFESVTGLKVTETEIVLGMSRAKVKPKRGYDWQVTERGSILYVFRRKNTEQPWALVDTIAVWWSTEELYASHIPTDEN